MHSRTQHNAGFTLVELLIAMSVLGLMLFLINVLFQDTARAVTTGTQTSKVLANARVINEQISDDALAMIGPASSNGGYIVIIQQRLPAVPMLDPQTLTEVPNPVILRSDQLVFIRDAAGLQSMTPQSNGRYGSNLVGLAGDVAKVWYGHALRTDESGGNGANPLDRIGSNFILGRQALLFDPYDPVRAEKLSAALATVPGAYVYADTPYSSATVQNAGGAPTQRLYMGLTDVTNVAYSTLVGDLTGFGAINAAPYWGSAYTDVANQRMHVNPSPNPGATDFESWAIAQTHPILGQSCSEFIIDFAADLNADGEIDTDFGGVGGLNEPIHWYDVFDPAQATLGTTTTWTPSAIAQPFVNLGANTRAFIFRVDDYQADSHWPYLIRIRYRLHDTRGRLTSNNPSALNDGLDNDGDGGAPDEAGEDRITGRWFERIIRVPRP